MALYFDDPANLLSTPGPIADSLGTTQLLQIRVPPNTADGAHQICGDTGADSLSQPIVVKACAAFTVANTPAGLSPAITVTVVPQPQGVELDVTGSGFPASVPMAQSIDGGRIRSERVFGPLEMPTDQSGGFQWKSMWLPFEYVSFGGTIALSNGPHQFCAFVLTSTAIQACTQFVIQDAPSTTPIVYPSPTPTASPGPSPIAAPSTSSHVAFLPTVAAFVIGAALIVLVWVIWQRGGPRGI